MCPAGLGFERAGSAPVLWGESAATAVRDAEPELVAAPPDGAVLVSLLLVLPCCGTARLELEFFEAEEVALLDTAKVLAAPIARDKMDSRLGRDAE